MNSDSEIKIPQNIIYYRSKQILVTTNHLKIGDVSIKISDIVSTVPQEMPPNRLLGIGLILLGLLSCGLIVTDPTIVCCISIGSILVATGAVVTFKRRPSLIATMQSGEIQRFDLKTIQVEKTIDAIGKAQQFDISGLDLTLFSERKTVCEQLSKGVVRSLELFGKNEWGGQFSIYYRETYDIENIQDSFEWIIRHDGTVYGYILKLLFQPETSVPEKYRLMYSSGIFDITIQDCSKEELSKGLYSFLLDKIKNKEKKAKSLTAWDFEESGALQVFQYSSTLYQERQTAVENVTPYVVRQLEDFASRIWSGDCIIYYDSCISDSNDVNGKVEWRVRTQTVTPLGSEWGKDAYEYPYYSVFLFFDEERPDYFFIFTEKGSISTDNFDNPVSEDALRQVLNKVIFEIYPPSIEHTRPDLERMYIDDNKIKRLR